MKGFEKIVDCRIETIQDSTFLDALSKDQERTFFYCLSYISENLKRPFGKSITLTYRGENFNNLASKLMSIPGTISEDKLVSLLFYFGDKAKHFYEIDDVAAQKLRWIKSIEDNSNETLEIIYKKTKQLLKNKNDKVIKFCEKNPTFALFFKNDNKSHFLRTIINDKKYGRDYYIYLLHTAGKIGIGNKSLLVSTTRSYSIAESFSGNNDTRYILYYVIPYPLMNYAVTHSIMKTHEKYLESMGLPIYKGASLYPDQNEVAIKGALFSHHILGMMVVDKKRFIVNPHLFKKPNSSTSFSKGLEIDQSEFEKKLKATGYMRGVGTFLEGNYHTIVKP